MFVSLSSHFSVDSSVCPACAFESFHSPSFLLLLLRYLSFNSLFLRPTLTLSLPLSVPLPLSVSVSLNLSLSISLNLSLSISLSQSLSLSYLFSPPNVPPLSSIACSIPPIFCPLVLLQRISVRARQGIRGADRFGR